MKITLCGSTRFEKEFHEWKEKLVLAGHLVFDLAVYPSTKNLDRDWYDPKQKEMFDLVYLALIEESDAIFVINPGRYVGDSTRREIQWARIRQKRIYWLEPDRSNYEAGADFLLITDVVEPTR